MKHLTILIPNGQVNIASVIGSYMIINKAESCWQSDGNKPVFKIELAGLSNETSLYNNLFSVRTQKDISEISKTDLIIIPAMQPDSDYYELIKQNKPLINWVKQQYEKGSEIASICTGAFLLASTGLINKKNCSTHWVAANTFKQMFPEVNLVPEKIITDEDGIYTSGGAFSFLNYLLYLVEKYYDRRTAIHCSKIFEIDIDRISQSPFIIFVGQKNHNDELIKKTQHFIENNFSEKITFETLTADYAISRRNFDRRFKRATGNTPVEYLQRVKIEAAKKSFETTGKTVKEVMFEVGYTDSNAFRSIFKRITGLSPIQYRNKYNKGFAQVITI